MHRLLRRQLQRHLGRTDVPSEWAPLLEAIDKTYHQHDQDRALLERSLALSAEAPNERFDSLAHQLAINKAARDDLEQTLSLLDATFNATGEGLLVVDPDGRIVRFNEVFIRQWAPPQAVLAQGDADALQAHCARQAIDRHGFLATVQQVAADPRGESRDVVELRDGRVLERFTAPQLQGAACIGRLWSFRDMTDSFRTAQALHASKESLREAQRIAAVGSWEWLPGEDRVRFSDELLVLLGRERPPPRDDLMGFLALIPGQYERELMHTLIVTTATEGGSYAIEHPLRTASGEIRHFVSRGQLVIDDSPRPARLLGVVHDISERKAVEARLGLSNRVFEVSSQGILITDAALTIVEANPAARQMLNLPAEQLVGQRLYQLPRGESGHPFNKECTAALLRGDPWWGEMRIPAGDGTEREIWIAFSPMCDAGGQVINHVGMFSDITKLKAVEEQLQQLAYYDPLTGLLNRRMFKEKVDALLRHDTPAEKPLAVLFIDLDRFKYVNDSLGHLCGDELLVMVAKRIRERVRTADLVSRQGGDEFTVALHGVHDRALVSETAQRIIDAITQPFHVVGQNIYIGASIGICMVPEQAPDFDEAMRKADMAMYLAKAMGKGKFCYWDNETQTTSEDHVRLEAELREAVRLGQLLVFYQPIVDCRTQQAVAMEALVRWPHAERGLVPPDEFIPIAEEVGLIVELEHWVIDEVCRQQALWCREQRAVVPVSVNISARHLGDPGLQRQFEDAVTRHAISPTLLAIEVTESTAMDDPQETEAVLTRLQRLGIQSAIDDFGTGYSSLSYLKRLPVCKLKIDRSFVRDLTTDPNDRGIAKTIVDLANSLAMQTVAEGVETEAQLAVLRDMGCDQVQGWLFARALPADEAGAFLDRHGAPCARGTAAGTP